MPELTAVRRLPLFSLKEHLNSVAPLEPGVLWGILHNLGAVRTAGFVADQNYWATTPDAGLRSWVRSSGSEVHLTLTSSSFLHAMHCDITPQADVLRLQCGAQA